MVEEGKVPPSITVEPSMADDDCGVNNHSLTLLTGSTTESQTLITSSTKRNECDQGLWGRIFGRNAPPASRTIKVPMRGRGVYCANIVRNQKYSLFSFIPHVLYEQFFPQFAVGPFFTYLSPLAFVLLLTMIKEGLDDYQRYCRDCAANSQQYSRIELSEKAETVVLSSQDISAMSVLIPSSEIAVGDILLIEKDQRIPADMILVWSSDRSTGASFIRTDQLDGETDWKLRLAVPAIQHASSLLQLFSSGIEINCEPPSKEIHLFAGTIAIRALGVVEPLSIENTLWMNTVLASGTAIGIVIYTGKETRAVMNTSRSTTKFGLIDEELNSIAKVLFLFSLAMSVMMISMKSFVGPWVIYLVRFFILFSSIIPLSLRVNLDMARMYYAKVVGKDPSFAPGSVIVRNSSIPEELGRIGFLLSDKTGTLTQNVMAMRKLHLGTLCFTTESFPEMAQHLVHHVSHHSFEHPGTSFGQHQISATDKRDFVRRGKKDMSTRVWDVVQALALCHNVTPAGEDILSYQASSPDEVAIVSWTRSIGLTLVFRDRESIVLRREADGVLLSYNIIAIFPFSSEIKRMGIIVRDLHTNEIIFFEKGADVVMAGIVHKSDWLQEECDNMAREGLRTLVVARKRLTEEQLSTFLQRYAEAALQITDRTAAKQSVIGALLEHEMEVLGITGVEDRLQEDVRVTLESLRNAGIRIWMLTGDKVETATSIGISSKLIPRNATVVQIQGLHNPNEISSMLALLKPKNDAVAVIDGISLQMLLNTDAMSFINTAAQLQAVICCRCTPTQKAEVARLLRSIEGGRRRVCCIGDGGNDVSMIQAADIGIGLVGREGMQASLAADYSLTRFCDIARLLLWHGRNSYKRTAKLSQFVIHRGFIISVLQAVFSSLFYFSPIALYQGILSIGYSTIFTTFPVFSLVLDTDIGEELALLYPELYKELTKGRALCYRSLFQWILVSLYQGGIIMFLAIWLFETDFIHIVSISFSALLFNELLMVVLQLNSWNKFIIVSEIFSILCYFATVRYLKASFDPLFISSLTFLWKVLLITIVSFLPLLLIKVVRRIVSPPNYAKLS